MHVAYKTHTFHSDFYSCSLLSTCIVLIASIMDGCEVRGARWRDKARKENREGKTESTRRRQEHPGISHHGDRAVDEADIAGCSLWDSEPLEPQIHVDVTELGERRGGKYVERGWRRRKGGEEEETDCRPRNNERQGHGSTAVPPLALRSPGHLCWFGGVSTLIYHWPHCSIYTYLLFSPSFIQGYLTECIFCFPAKPCFTFPQLHINAWQRQNQADWAPPLELLGVKCLAEGKAYPHFPSQPLGYHHLFFSSLWVL